MWNISNIILSIVCHFQSYRIDCTIGHLTHKITTVTLLFEFSIISSYKKALLTQVNIN